MAPRSAAADDLAQRRRCLAACETCKRRKERCDGRQPCERCITRKVPASCHFADRSRLQAGDDVRATPPRRLAKPPQTPSGRRSSLSRRSTYAHGNPAGAPASPPSTGHGTDDPMAHHVTIVATSGSSSLVDMDSPHTVRDHKGEHMFIGDSANLFFLQIIRRLVARAIGPCDFVDDPIGCLMIEASPMQDAPSGQAAATRMGTPRLTVEQARHFVRRYALVTGCVLDLFDESTLLAQLPGLPEDDGADIPAPMYYLVLAIGAQTSAGDHDALAAALFNVGRSLVTQQFTEDATLATVQAYALITFYLLGACRRNAAFMHLGIAVRAAYAIGLHRKEIAKSLSLELFELRERTWKCLRILDLFLSASLGRPPSTAETRDTESMAEYSTSTDLCVVFEKILTSIYSPRVVSTEAVSSIGAHHRRFTSRFLRGLARDKISATEKLGGGLMPNIGLLHVKEAYYWTIILLTRPFLLESISTHTAKVAEGSSEEAAETCTGSDSNRILVEACVDSAMRTIDLLRKLNECEDLPKRLPYIVNSIFIASLVLGTAYFGDLYQIYSLDRYLHDAHELLKLFTHDQVAQQSSTVVGFLRDACNTYREKQAARIKDRRSRAIGSIFGQIHATGSEVPTRAQSPSQIASQDVQTQLRSGCEGKDDRAVHMAAGQPLSDATEDDVRLCEQGYDDFYELMIGANLAKPGLPFSDMSPQTLWFTAYDESLPMFTIVEDIGGNI